jgi:hypothetical protein
MTASAFPRLHLARRTTALAIAALSALPAQAEDAASIIELICGRTVHYFNPALGNQIEYTAPNGEAYLWHSLTERIVIGIWEVNEISPGVGEVCYKYLPGSFSDIDPGSEFCFDYGALVADVPADGVREGDPYNLASGEMPFPLPFENPMSVEDLRDAYPDQPPERACGMLMM